MAQTTRFSAMLYDVNGAESGYRTPPQLESEGLVSTVGNLNLLKCY